MKEIVADKDTKIIDVRTKEEFSGGHVVESINIPLNEIPSKIEELKSYQGQIVLCCASGNRSGQAVHFLEQNGFNNVHNGGGWLEVNYLKNQK
jgi:rhodanese-related sulfurtransferase